MSLDRERVVELLPQYEVEGELGRGGWGVVLGGTHKALGREVAIKQLPRAFAADPEVRARFLSEARLLASLDHPHIVPVYDFAAEDDGMCVLVIEKLPGGTVWSRFREKGFTVTGAVSVTLATCAALHYAHQRGILHRDVKPENLMFTGSNILKVTDFGIAKVLGGAQTMATRAGDVLGTPAYMAPEQALGEELGPFTDVYAAGVMLYELLTGTLPFPESGDSPLAMVYRKIHEPPRPILEAAPKLNPAIADVAMKAIATERTDRWQDAQAFGVALAEAVTAVYGPGWLGKEGLEVMAAGPILSAAERTTIVPPPPAAVTGIIKPEHVAHVTGGNATSLNPSSAQNLTRETLNRLSAALRKSEAPEARELMVEVEKLQSSDHDGAESALLARITGGAVKLKAAEADEAARLLGRDGPGPETRLGLPPGTPPPVLKAAAQEALAKWQKRAENPLSSRDVAEAARTLVRTCEGMLASLPG